MAERLVLGGWPGFSLPDLSDANEGWAALPVEEIVIDVRHHDTDDLRLAGDGIAVTAADDQWTVALPGNRLIELHGESASSELSSLLVAHLRGEPLVEVARIRTHRRGVEVRDGAGQTIGRVVDDEVSVIDHDRVAARFRELVIESGPSPVAATIERALRAAGATDPDPMPRLQRALGGVTAPPVGPWSSAAELLAHQLGLLRRRWLRNDVLFRSGQLGPTRYAGPPARLRALVRAMRPLVDRDWAESLDGLIAPLDALSQAAARAARLASFVEAAAARLDAGDASDSVRIVAEARDEAKRALENLRDELDTRGYLDLVEAVVQVTDAAPFGPDSHGAGVVLLPRLAAELFGAWRRSARVVDPADHERLDRTIARIDRVAAIATAAAPAVAGAERHAVRLRSAGRVLADFEVMDEATRWLRDRVELASAGRRAFVAGVLAATLQHDRFDLADAWSEIWRRAERRKARAWLTS